MKNTLKAPVCKKKIVLSVCACLLLTVNAYGASDIENVISLINVGVNGAKNQSQEEYGKNVASGLSALGTVLDSKANITLKLGEKLTAKLQKQGVQLLLNKNNIDIARKVSSLNEQTKKVQAIGRKFTIVGTALGTTMDIHDFVKSEHTLVDGMNLTKNLLVTASSFVPIAGTAVVTLDTTTTIIVDKLNSTQDALRNASVAQANYIQALQAVAYAQVDAKIINNINQGIRVDDEKIREIQRDVGRQLTQELGRVDVENNLFDGDVALSNFESAKSLAEKFSTGYFTNIFLNGRVKRFQEQYNDIQEINNLYKSYVDSINGLKNDAEAVSSIEESLAEFKHTVSKGPALSGDEAKNPDVQDVAGNNESTSGFLRNNLMQNQLTAITQGGSSRIGTASYFIGRPPAQDRAEKPRNLEAAMREQKFNIADLQGIREASQYTNGQILTAPVDILLNWGANPSDLDSHLTGPMADGSSTRFHTYYASRGSLDSAPNALLHSDYTNHHTGGANLPEQTRINTLNEGVYRFYVHDYSNSHTTDSTALANSGATVTFHNAGSTSIVEGQGIGEEVARISVPSDGVGNTWQAFELDSRTGILNRTTQVRNVSNPAEVPFND